MRKVAVLVSGGGTNLQALIDAQGSVIQSGKIALVITKKPVRKRRSAGTRFRLRRQNNAEGEKPPKCIPQSPLTKLFTVWLSWILP